MIPLILIGIALVSLLGYMAVKLGKLKQKNKQLGDDHEGIQKQSDSWRNRSRIDDMLKRLRNHKKR